MAKALTRTTTSEVAPLEFESIPMGQIVARMNIDEVSLSNELAQAMEGMRGEFNIDQESKYERNYHPDGTLSNEFFMQKKTINVIKE